MLLPVQFVVGKYTIGASSRGRGEDRPQDSLADDCRELCPYGGACGHRVRLEESGFRRLGNVHRTWQIEINYNNKVRQKKKLKTVFLFLLDLFLFIA